jgi:hypothetical protein
MTLTTTQRADALEQEMSRALDERFIAKAALYISGDQDPRSPMPRPPEGKLVLMGDDPRLAPMPEAPTLADFWRLRFAPGQHLLQSARLAQKAGHSEKVVIACILHDISMLGFIRNDHGYWGAELVEPYVDEEVAWAIRYHQALRFFPDEAFNYPYPEMYVRLFGADYKPEPYIVRDYEYARAHKFYGTSRLITLNDVYAWDPDLSVSLDDFTDIIGRNFRQPKEGLGFDSSPCAHLWRTMIWPTKFL